jgi:hypothetical protein
MHSRLVAGGSLLLPNCRTAGAISIRRNIVHIDQEYPTRMYENRYVREHQRKRDETLPKDFYKKVQNYRRYISQFVMLVFIVHRTLWPLREHATA